MCRALYYSGAQPKSTPIFSNSRGTGVREREGAGNHIRASSCGGLVLVDESSEYVTAADTVEGYEGLRPRLRLRFWRSLREGAVGAMRAVTTDVDGRTRSRCRRFTIRSWSRHSRRSVPTHRSM